MSVRRPTIVRLAVGFGLGLLMAHGSAGSGLAQHFDTDPYHPWNSDTMPFATPAVAPNFALPNQAIYRGGRDFMPRGNGPGRLESYYNSVGIGPGMPGPGFPAGNAPVPYGMAASFGVNPAQVFIPNAQVDSEYYQARIKRQELYNRARDEPDPKKRAELLQEYEEATRRAARQLSAARRQPQAPAGTPSATAAPRTATGPAAPPIPGHETTPQPTTNYSVRRFPASGTPGQAGLPAARRSPASAPPPPRDSRFPSDLLLRSRRISAQMARSSRESPTSTGPGGLRDILHRDRRGESGPGPAPPIPHAPGTR